ncbi:MAG: beta-ketoacyl-ACP synthase III, partial [Pseudomonadota bacterium]|nr:beta-ketoacyl-ACP synthase III [Pseudomonadota bacterium]
ERVLTNRDLEQMVDTSDAWITERTGIRERRIAAPQETAGSMGEIAARRALESAALSVDDLDLIIVATCTPDQVFPSTACLLQERLGAAGGPAFDVSAACAGFLYALGTADRFIRSGGARNALVVGTEVMSRVIDWTDRSTCILFADGAGALVLEAADDPGIYSTHLHANGRHKDLLWVPGWVASDYDAPPEHPPHMRMRGNEVFRVAVKELGNSVEEAVNANGLERGQVDWLVPHQANLRIIRAVAKRLQLPMEKVVVTIDRHGNTSSASVPLALDEAVRDGRVRAGDTLLLEAFGGGFAWGSALLRF